MAKKLRISGVQMVVSKDLSDNLPRILNHIRAAAEDGADLVMFPEMSLSGYHGDFDTAEVEKAVEAVATAARDSAIAVIVGTGWREQNGDIETFIQNRIYGSDGTLLGTHEKMVPTGADTDGDRSFCVPGKELRTFTWEGITCGSLICNDLWCTPGCGPWHDPRLMYQLGQKGAKVVFHAINSGTSQLHTPYHESNVKLRAMESGMYVATANAASMDASVNCSTGVMGPDGEWCTRIARQGEGRYLVELPFDKQ